MRKAGKARRLAARLRDAMDGKADAVMRAFDPKLDRAMGQYEALLRMGPPRPPSQEEPPR